jgi:L-seryl-tRNA(Ser) seleniumtransferase
MINEATTTQFGILPHALPSVDALLRTDAVGSLRQRLGDAKLTALARCVIEEMRAEILSRTLSTELFVNDGNARTALLEEAARRLKRAYEQESRRQLQYLINASGVILHTNLGRAPLSDAARQAIAHEAARYCTLEYDLETGARGTRGIRVEELLCELTTAESALIVNNCAAAVLLTLTALAQGGEAIISRGELVEIGGDFRVPDVMRQSGARMIEVGTTNRTRLADYEQAINDATRLIVRVHPSNYRIIGFTARPTLSDLAALAHKANLILYEDAGSGALSSLVEYGLEDEPVIRESVKAGASVVTFSGDKLLGASQAGLIVGHRAVVEKLRRHPLYRALRVDKLALAALEATLDAHRRQTSFMEVPALRMLALTKSELDRRARKFLAKLRRRINARSSALRGKTIAGQSAIGGGAAPMTHLPTTLIALTHQRRAVLDLERALRASSPPVIARINEGLLLIDLRTVAEDEEKDLLEALAALA